MISLNFGHLYHIFSIIFVLVEYSILIVILRVPTLLSYIDSTKVLE